MLFWRFWKGAELLIGGISPAFGSYRTGLSHKPVSAAIGFNIYGNACGKNYTL
jgi:hypothetical protein